MLLRTMGRPNSLLEFFCLVEGPEDDMDDDELDRLTDPRPYRGANPFDPPTQKAPPSNPVGSGLSKKDQTPMSAPTPKTAVGGLSNLKIPYARAKGNTKPGYRGQFVGHSVKQNGQMVPKNVAWTDKQSGDKRFGKVMGMQNVEWVWDGSDWVHPAQFDMKFGAGKK